MSESKTVCMVFPYDRFPIFRRSAMSKKDWSYICHKFGVDSHDPKSVRSIAIDGEDDYGRLMITVTFDEDAEDFDDDQIDYDEAIWYT